MTSLHTNVLVRYLVKDDARQHAVAVKVIESESHSADFFIPITVALELEWVLRSRYGVDKLGIIDTYTRLLETGGIQFQDESSIERALSLFSEYSADFADCLHIAISMSNDVTPFVTFDKKAAKIPHSTLPSFQ